MHQETHFIARGQRQARAEVALTHRARAGDQVLHRARQPLRRPDRAVDRRQHGDQQHQRQRQPEVDLKGLARRRHIAVIRKSVLHRIGEPGKLCGHVVVDDHKAARRHECSPRQRRRGDDGRTAAGGRLQGKIAAAGGDLQPHLGRGRRRERRAGTGAAEAQRAAARVVHRDVGGLRRAAFGVEPHGEVRPAQPGDRVREIFGAARLLVQPQFERRA